MKKESFFITILHEEPMDTIALQSIAGGKTDSCHGGNTLTCDCNGGNTLTCDCNGDNKTCSCHGGGTLLTNDSVLINDTTRRRRRDCICLQGGLIRDTDHKKKK